MVLIGDSAAELPAMDQPAISDGCCAGVWDALIIGAGPAGSMAARHLAACGRRVLLLDRSRFPREKVCGDALAPDALAVLQRAGLAERVQRIGHGVDGLRVFSPSQIEAEIRGSFLMLRRRALDALLAQAAIEAGASFRLAEVRTLEIDSGGQVTCGVAETERPIRARAALVATGANVCLIDRLGLVARRQASGIAARCYVRSALQLDHLVFSFERSALPGYRWIFPLGQGLYNVGCISFARTKAVRSTNLSRMFSKFTGGFPLASELIRRGEVLTPLRGARVRTGLTGAELAGRGPIVAIGESIGSTFPVSGEGVGNAMESAVLAADVIHEALSCPGACDLQSFATRITTTMRQRFRSYESIERWMCKPRLNDFVLGRVAKSRMLRQAFSRIINDQIDPRSVFSYRALWRSLWG